MRAAVYEGEGRLVVRDVPDPTPGPDEVLIEVEACGVCGSDVQIINVPPGHPSTPPVIIGHEFVGWVRAAGSAVRDAPIGARVVVDPDPKCGACEPCRAGRPANCTNIVALGVYRDGALAALRYRPGQQRVRHLARGSHRAGGPGRAAVVRRQRDEPGGDPAGRIGGRVRSGSHRLPVQCGVPRGRRGADRRRRAERPARPGRPGRRGRLRPDARRVDGPPRRAPAERSGRRGRRGRQRPARRDLGRRHGRPGRGLRDERDGPPAGPPGRDRREGSDDPRLVHLELHVPRRDPTRRERQARTSLR